MSVSSSPSLGTLGQASQTLVLQEYLWYRMGLVSTCGHRPRFYCLDADDDNVALFVPAGADSLTLIDSTSTAPPVVSSEMPQSPQQALAERQRVRRLTGSVSSPAAPTGGRQVLTDHLALELVFSPPHTAVTAVAREPEVRAEDDQFFLRELQHETVKDDPVSSVGKSQTVAAARQSSGKSSQLTGGDGPKPVDATSAAPRVATAASKLPTADNKEIKGFFNSLLAGGMIQRSTTTGAPAAAAGSGNAAAARVAALTALESTYVVIVVSLSLSSCFLFV
jgi:hypothetical protein